MGEQTYLETAVREMARKAQEASRELATISSAVKNTVLATVAELLLEKRAEIEKENAKDLAAGREKGLSDAMLERLTLSDNVINGMRNGLQEVIALPDPVGEITGMKKRPNGMMVGRMRIPLGVVGMIYESRPNVTVDAAALCLKTGNSVVLRGGSEAIQSNKILAAILQEALKKNGVNPDCVQLIQTTDRAAIHVLLAQEEYLDLIIPRGGEGLIRFVSENSKIPVLKHYKGVCHIFVDKDADLNKATPIIINSKVQRPGVCNALEGLLIHEDVAEKYLPVITEALHRENVKMFGCPRSVEIGSNVTAASEEEWGTEFLDLALCIKVVKNISGAEKYIARYGSKHTETIITENYSTAQYFIAAIDASAVIVNASTRFNDGGQLGLGTEIGISTTKLHAYGPMGLEELTTRKFIIYGTGQVRK